MRAKISQEFLKKIGPRDKIYEVRDTELRGFLLRVRPNGTMSYVAEYARGKRITIGPTSALKAEQARKKAHEYISSAVLGDDPMQKRKAQRAHTLSSFVSEHYEPWVKAHLRYPGEAIRRMELFLPTLGSRKLPEIDAFSIEKWRSARLKEVTPLTCNHDLDVLRAALNKAVEWNMLEVHPMRTVKRSRVDDSAKVRYLSEDESKRLRRALDAREEKRRKNRDAANRWRRQRGYPLFSPFGAFTDHLKPLTLIALNTGMRRGELFNLAWSDVDMSGRIVTIVGKTAKSGKTRHIPLNDEAFDVLLKWHGQRGNSELVFPSPDDGDRMGSIKTAWLRLMRSAKIGNFRFHDTRHDFASQLVMAGVDLNTVRELLGHSDIKMTLRYAHLAPQKLAAAVAMLGGAR